ncbi:hypothetical protein QTP70_007468 [Hemibagrus guttatus]|uniref:Uncharacterized protein n=1 Tax=Hemibagrus guttatus TaxID=175788 RepID=A0AAE0UQJ3_9TELE|nr:hypothetical protein QTP70_007468 [Hemibagrus guttatus]
MGGQAKAKKKGKPKRKENRGGPENAALSPQDRMKARMQERAKKKTAEKYTIDQLLEKTEECMDNFDFPMAKMFCQRALDIEPTNLTILDMLGNICAELGDMDKAKQVFLKAVELSPEEGHSKYMYLGQIHTGAESVQYFSKGIEVMLKAMDKQAEETNQNLKFFLENWEDKDNPSCYQHSVQKPASLMVWGCMSACGMGSLHIWKGTINAESMGAAALPSESPITAKDVSVAFCSIAEIFFTDLCMEEGAAERCKEAIEKALHYDQNNPEALQLMASYLFRDRET